MPITPKVVAKQQQRPVSPRASERVCRLELFSSYYLDDPTCSSIARVYDAELPANVAPGYLRIKVVSLTVGFGDVIRHGISLNRADTFPLASGITAIGRLVSAGPHSGNWNFLPEGITVLVVRPFGTKVETMMDLHIKFVHNIPDADMVHLLVGPAITAAMIEKSLVFRAPAPTGQQQTVLITNGDSASAMVITLKLVQLAYSVTVVVSNGASREMYSTVQGISIHDGFQILKTWVDESRKFDVIISSTDWSSFSNVYFLLKLCKPFASFMVIHGPNNLLNRAYSTRIQLFGNYCVPILWCSPQSDKQRDYPNEVQSAIRYLLDNKLVCNRFICDVRYHGIESVRTYVKDSVESPTPGLRSIRFG